MGSNSTKDTLFRRRMQRNYHQMAQSKQELEKIGKEGSALLCVECGACIPKCSQSINIPEELKKVNETLTKKMNVRDKFRILPYFVKNWRSYLSRLL